MTTWKTGRVISVGECMVELAREPDGRFGLAYGGDTFNTAVYLARAGIRVAYVTALGDDPYSKGIVDLATREHVDTDLVTILAGRMPGLYLIETSTQGERSFWYWRDRAAARDVFECSGTERMVQGIESAAVVYFSGVTLSLYSERGLDIFAEALQSAKSNGARIVMDSNYRPRGWGGDLERARRTFARFWQLSDIALPTLDDEQALWEDANAEAVAERLSALGVPEIAVKSGPGGAYVHAECVGAWVPCPERIDPVDTTAAGDSFNAGYVAVRSSGGSAMDAALLGHRLAAVVICHRGAIVPQSATAAVFADR